MGHGGMVKSALYVPELQIVAVKSLDIIDRVAEQHRPETIRVLAVGRAGVPAIDMLHVRRAPS
jgi:hypothetical protein